MSIVKIEQSNLAMAVLYPPFSQHSIKATLNMSKVATLCNEHIPPTSLPLSAWGLGLHLVQRFFLGPKSLHHKQDVGLFSHCCRHTRLTRQAV